MRIKEMMNRINKKEVTKCLMIALITLGLCIPSIVTIENERDFKLTFEHKIEKCYEEYDDSVYIVEALTDVHYAIEDKAPKDDVIKYLMIAKEEVAMFELMHGTPRELTVVDDLTEFLLKEYKH